MARLGRGRTLRLAELALPAPFAADYAPPGDGAMDTGLLVIAFSSIGHDPDRMPAPEFCRMATGPDRAALFFRDQSRSWASHPDWAAALLQAVAAVPLPVRRIVTLGVSMGAVSALRAAEVLAVEAVLALGPQHDLTQEPRWANWTAGRSVPPCPLPLGPWITLCHGMQDDAAQAMAFPVRKGVDHLLFQGLDHSGLAPSLKARGLRGMVDALCRGDRRRLLAIAQAAGGQRRQLPR